MTLHLSARSDLLNVKKQGGQFVLQPSQTTQTKSNLQADLAALQTGKASTADLAAILTRLLQHLLEEP